MTTVVFARLLMRYLAGALMAYGLISPETGNMLATDPDLIGAVGVLLGFAAESLYALAKRRGWAT